MTRVHEQSLFARAIESAGGPEALLAQMGPDAIAVSMDTWEVRARPSQLMPALSRDWRILLWLAGRGFGKTACLSGMAHALVERGYGRLALVAPTAADVRDTVIEGDSGVLRWSPPHRARPTYEPSKRKVTFWNGATALCFSAEEPDRLRGVQFHGALCDEIAAWKYAQQTWDMLQFCLRLGAHPVVGVATTPRPIPLIKALVRDPRARIVKGTTYDNTSNLAESFLDNLRDQYEGTRLGRQEIGAEILEDNPSALWKASDIESSRRGRPMEFVRIVVGVDPAVSNNPKSCETGIVTCGVARCSCKGTPELHGFVLSDDSGMYSPAQWAQQVVRVYGETQADRVIAEINNGGALVESNLRASDGGDRVSYKGVHAAKGKQTRAEPIAALYEQGKIHHVGALPKLEDQLTSWNPIEDGSPDRLDALVWALTDLMLEGGTADFEPSEFELMPRRASR